MSSGTRNCFQLSLPGIFISIFNIYRNGFRAKMLFGWGILDVTLREGNGHPGAESYKGQVEQAHSRGGAKDPSVKTGAYLGKSRLIQHCIHPVTKVWRAFIHTAYYIQESSIDPNTPNTTTLLQSIPLLFPWW